MENSDLIINVEVLMELASGAVCRNSYRLAVSRIEGLLRGADVDYLTPASHNTADPCAHMSIASPQSAPTSSSSPN